MKLVIDVKDSKADLLLEFLRTLTYVKVRQAPSEDTDQAAGKAEVLAGVKEAVEEMKLVKAGKLKGRDAMDFLNEL
jgi:hypothetical protein